jgi:ketol-acid reductoisomerase
LIISEGNAVTLETWHEDDIADGMDGAKVAVLGYGAQGRAQARNLHDSGAQVTVGLRDGSSSAPLAHEDGMAVASMADAVSTADWIAFLLPDENHGTVYREHVAPHARRGAVLVFAHGFSFHYELLTPRPDLDVVLAAPKGAGFQLRATYEAGNGVPGLVGVGQDATGRALTRGLSFLKGLGCARAGVMATTFRDETETDLFGEQVVLCGGVPALVRGAFETLTEAGYPPELAYFECLHELKLICDLLHTRGIAGMSTSISNTAEYGALTAGPRVMDEQVREHMREVLAEVRDGSFAREFMAEAEAGAPALRDARDQAARHPIERVGKRLRAMMPWLSD